MDRLAGRGSRRADLRLAAGGDGGHRRVQAEEAAVGDFRCDRQVHVLRRGCRCNGGSGSGSPGKLLPPLPCPGSPGRKILQQLRRKAGQQLPGMRRGGDAWQQVLLPVRKGAVIPASKKGLSSVGAEGRPFGLSGGHSPTISWISRTFTPRRGTLRVTDRAAAVPAASPRARQTDMMRKLE